ncbi:MAG TPA: pyridoxine 5'-phosphate synthase [Candidatus Omnitrophota bacterium]|nr:pyridoxine 5'-phosphate synthase [Candidatus Omnitrophota bacterium]HPS21129.1 pyridoxine 5'-phosphate synthase [Candidatus Omnitrophota bacterium]
MKLGVNIDHVATVREARKTFEPDIIKAAFLAEKGGADGIVCHLRKDRRHMQDKDIFALRKKVRTRLNLEMSVDPEIVSIACKVKPDQATIVPENRQEVTTEGGLDVAGNFKKVKATVDKLSKKGIEVSLFIDPEKEQIDASCDTGARLIEFHTGRFANMFSAGQNYKKELKVLKEMTVYAMKRGLIVCAGHGLTYDNVRHVACIDGIYELNIGHTIISRSVFSGIEKAVREMKALI